MISNKPLAELHALREKEKNRRLVACWKALEGVPTEWLENYVAGGAENLLQENAKLYTRVNNLEEQNGNLLNRMEGFLALQDENIELKQKLNSYVDTGCRIASGKERLKKENAALRSENERLRNAQKTTLNHIVDANKKVGAVAFRMKHHLETDERDWTVLDIRFLERNKHPAYVYELLYPQHHPEIDVLETKNKYLSDSLEAIDLDAKTLVDEIEALKAEVEKLTKERDAAINLWKRSK